MSFLRINERLKNGSKSGVYVYGDGKYINIYVAIKSQSRRGGGDSVRLTYQEMIEIARDCKRRGWVD